MFLLMSGTNNFAKNFFLPNFEIVQNFHYFVRYMPVDFLSKIEFSKHCLKCCSNVSFDCQKNFPIKKKCFFWWVEEIILPKNIFLPHFEIVQNFQYFVRSAPGDFLSKIQFSLKCCKVRAWWFSVKNSIFQKRFKCCRNVSFDEWNK